MPDLLRSAVVHKTKLPDRYLEHASHHSMSVYLEDWREARDHLDRQIARLRVAQEERQAATEAGLWPGGGSMSTDGEETNDGR